MPEITRLSDSSEWIDPDFVEHERTPERVMKLGMQMNVAGLSFSNIIYLFDKLGVQQSRKAFHDWVQQADLQGDGDEDPNQIALDESVIRINDQQYQLYAAIGPDTNTFLYIRLFASYTTALIGIFLGELREKHDGDDTVSLVDDADWLKTALQRHGLDFRDELRGNRNSVERIFREVRRRTYSFPNCFGHVEPETAKTWLQTFAVWHNVAN